jgi:hypothetical protein
MKVGSIVAVLMAVLVSVAFMGANAQNWTETVTVPIKKTSSLTLSRFATSEDGTALESVRLPGATCIVITYACIYQNGFIVGALFRTSCWRLWVVYNWSLGHYCLGLFAVPWSQVLRHYLLGVPRPRAPELTRLANVQWKPLRADAQVLMEYELKPAFGSRTNLVEAPTEYLRDKFR